MARKALQRSTVTLQAQIFAHHENIFQLQMRFVPNFRRLYESLQLYWHFKQSVDATSTLPLTNTDTHTLTYVTHTCQACTHIVPNITAYFQAETFCLLRCKVMKFLKLTCETVKQCVYKENTQIYICVCVCRYVRVNRILRM